MKPKIEIAEILHSQSFWRHSTQFLATQKKDLHAMTLCRTAKLGRHIDHCGNCKEIRISYNSCRNRNCPKCQATYREKWITKREEEVLNVPYFHTVFTIPHVLNDLCLHNPEKMYTLLFKATWNTLKTFGESTLKGEMGMIAVLHTWGQNLSLHPHLHCIIPGGALVNGKHWKGSDKTGKYLFSAKGLAKMFRAKLLALIRKDAHLYSFFTAEIARKCFEKEWVVYAKRPFGGAKQIIEYLGRYTHKTAISNHRLLHYSDKKVTFSYKDYRNGAKKNEMTLSDVEFIRRYTQHLLPKGFRRIRHFGFYNGAIKKVKIEKIRKSIGQETPKIKEWDWIKLSKEKLGYDPLLCTCCGKREMVIMPRFASQRAPPNQQNVTENNLK
ncbi:IS91 family transposase [Flammeovirga pectinis]|uniref:IS91 family transposase n=1 Tax=Flammeovirga pectinis TaxID=2494373 RepID=A0A3Q9FUH0_9BACT|nr:IS91 family transposase [Flammeovirga pectinis]AZQ65384.1 IS91 family transposase [Flammeovirga pectinis]